MHRSKIQQALSNINTENHTNAHFNQNVDKILKVTKKRKGNTTDDSRNA